MKYDYIIVGAGIIGLSVAKALLKKYNYAKVLVVEKENEIALHQTGRNSGVIHSGIYYRPGSLKAKLAKKGNEQMVSFCKEHGIPYEICGKVIVATEENEMNNLNKLYELGVKNGLNVKKISEVELKEIEPHVNGLAGIRVPSTGIVDYRKVSEAFKRIINQCGGEIMLGTEVENIELNNDSVQVYTSRGSLQSKYLINCSGLLSDRVANISNVKTDLKIVPFRGEYYELKKDRRHLVKNLIYPVPNPDFPFLGVHFTRMIDGRILVGPNAVLSLKREGYNKTSFHWKDALETLTYQGFWKLAFRNMNEGLMEMYRSFNKKAFIKDVQRFIPEIKEDDLLPAQSGVRAQALESNGELLDDFAIIKNKNTIHVCNAPSPAATASIEIGERIVAQIDEKSETSIIN